MKQNSERRAGIGISSSTLGVCPRQFILAERNDYYESPGDYYNRWRGSFGHYAIEMGGPYPGIVQELRFYRGLDVEGELFEISGQPDWINLESHHIDDSKFVTWVPKAPYPDHERQVNVYHWLVTEGRIKAERATGDAEAISPIPSGWRADSLSITYRDTRGERTFEIPVWTDDAVESYIRGRLTPLVHYYRDGNIARLRIGDEADKWKGKYCPFHHPDNPGRCCMAQEQN